MKQGAAGRTAGTARMIAGVAGIGRLPAPGTVASVAALPFGVLLLRGGPWPLLLAAAAACLAGSWAIPRAPGAAADPGWVVIDEVAGQWIALLGLMRFGGPPAAWPNWIGVLAALALFRLFDIAKPGPIGWADRRVGASGVMADDVLAGAAAAALLALARLAAPGWLA